MSRVLRLKSKNLEMLALALDICDVCQVVSSEEVRAEPLVLRSITNHASGSYSSLERWVFQGDKLPPQVIHRPRTEAVGTEYWYLTLKAPVWAFCSKVVMDMGQGKVP